MVVTGGELLLQALKAQGVDYIFGSPGTEWVPVWEGMLKLCSQGEKAPAYINCRHEALAVSVAGGYAKATGHLPAVLLHASLGPLNAAMSIRAAYHQQIPMLICAGDSSGFGEDESDWGEGWRWAHTLSDVGGPSEMVRPFVKWSGAVSSKETLLGQVCRACEIARTAPKGPVFLSIPWEFLLKSLPELPIPPASPPPRPLQPNPAAIEQAAAELLQARSPIILTEHAGADPEAVPRLVELAELLGIPVFECLNPRFANFPKDHPLHAGYNAAESLAQADLVFIVGANSPWQTASAFPSHGTRVILLDEDTAKDRLAYWGYRVDLKLTGNILQGLTGLLDVIRRSIPGTGDPQCQERLKQWQSRHKQLVTRWEREALAVRASKPIDPRWFFHVANKVLPGNAVVLDESPSCDQFIIRHIRNTQPGTYFNIVSDGLGRGLGEAAGIKLAWGARPVVLFTGDGSFSYNPVMAGLGLCQEYHLPILTVVLNNGGYDSMKIGYRSLYPRGQASGSNTYLGVDIAPSPDYVKIAGAFDGYGEKVTEPDQIEPALNRAWQQIMAGRAALLDVVLQAVSSRMR